MTRRILFLALLIALVPSGVARSESARSALAFQESVGVNTHLGYMDTQYNNSYGWLIKPKLLELGVSHIRDGTFPAHWSTGPTIAARYRELAAAGIRLNLLVGEEQAMNTGGTVQQRLDWIKAEGLTPHVIGIEGENESYRSSEAIRAQQCDIWNRVKGDPALSDKLVIGPSSGDGGDDWNWYNRVGDLSHCLDRGNLHPYPGEDPPNMRLSRDFATAMEWGRITFGDKPQWATESGYWNRSPNASHVSEQAGGVYVPRMAMEYFRRGIPRTQFYELIDLNNGTNEVINNYGLLRTDGSAKPAYTKLKNLLAILKDTGEASGSLDFSITCTAGCHSPIRHVLVKHSDGSYYIAAWSESRVWDNDADTPKAAQGIDLDLAVAPERVDVYNLDSTVPFRSVQDGSTKIATQVTDEVRLFRVTPGTAPPPPPPPTAMEFEAEGMKITPWFDVYPNPAVPEADVTASAGKRLFFRHYGEAEQTINTTSRANRLVVRAYGIPCVEAPKITVKVDGVSAGQRTIGGTAWTDYTFTIPEAAAGSHKVVISYDNDYEDAACNRNLYLDKATFSYVAPPTTVEAETMDETPWFPSVYPDIGVPQADSTASANARMKVQFYGELSKTITTTGAYSRAVIVAKGEFCREWPKTTLKINGQTVTQKVIDSPLSGAWVSYVAPVDLPAGTHKVVLTYDNDAEYADCNLNLYLDRLTLE